MAAQMTEQFVNALLSLSRVGASVDDRFLQQQFRKKLLQFIQSYVRFAMHSDKIAKIQSINATVALEDFLEYIHRDYPAQVRMVLLAQRALMEWKLMLVRHTSLVEHASKDTVPAAPVEVKLHENKKKILTFIQKTPAARSRDIIDEFRLLSARTVKRSLQDLIRSGLVKKQVKNHAVYYSSTENT